MLTVFHLNLLVSLRYWYAKLENQEVCIKGCNTVHVRYLGPVIRLKLP
jgi:hypothetical protein